jgi:YegS/Rv2252/BmrU family lipid kinase
MRLAVICNPTTVDDLEELQIEVKRRWPHDDVLWFETVPADPGAGQTRRALDEGVDVVLVAGGDGTVGQAVGVLAETQVALALLPVGTGNLLARNLGLPLNRGEALDRAAGSGRDHIDVLQAGGRCFTVMAGLGFDATMMRETDEAGKTHFGWLAYLGGGFRALRRTPRRRYAISVDGRPHVRITALAVMIGNVGQLQGGMDVLPDADPRDGLLDVIVLAPRTWRDTLGLVARIVRGHLRTSPRTTMFQGRTATVSVDKPVAAEFDGDYAGEISELTVTVLPGALRLCTR